MLYVSMSGLKQVLQAQAANSHNLANVSTPGFRADLQTFKDQQVYGDGYASRSYTSVNANGVDHSFGSIVNTGKDLDIAIKGEGYMAVQASDGREGYTRAGNFSISANGLLLDSNGRSVMGNGGSISIPPSEKIEIGVDGTISIIALGQQANTLAVLDRIKLVNPDKQQLSKGTDGLLYMPNNGTADADAKVRVVQGALETSNVNVIDAMVNMISLARTFEMQNKMMQTSKENDANSGKLLSLN